MEYVLKVGIHKLRSDYSFNNFSSLFRPGLENNGFVLNKIMPQLFLLANRQPRLLTMHLSGAVIDFCLNLQLDMVISGRCKFCL